MTGSCALVLVAKCGVADLLQHDHLRLGWHKFNSGVDQRGLRYRVPLLFKVETRKGDGSAERRRAQSRRC